jgi:3-phenylpropionate/trans-cinnamate dioxygenase ferredoxin subunit
MPRAVVCGFDELGPGQPRRFDIDGAPVCVVRIHDEVFAIGDVCTHQEISLSEGEVDLDECTIECWKHGSQFSLRDGVPMSLPATRPVPVYGVRITDGDVEVTVGGVSEGDPGDEAGIEASAP